MAALAAGVASLGFMVASAFSSPTDILEGVRDSEDDENNITIINVSKEIKKKGSILEKIPFLIRALVGIPLWFLGTLLIKLVTGVVKLVLAPIISFVLAWLFVFLMLLCVILLCLKLLFPNTPIKEFINKNFLITVAICSLAIKAIDLFMNKIVSSYNNYRFLVIFILGLISISIVIVPIVIKKSKEPKLICDDIKDLVDYE